MGEIKRMKVIYHSMIEYGEEGLKFRKKESVTK